MYLQPKPGNIVLLSYQISCLRRSNRSNLHSRGEVTEGALGRCIGTRVGVLDIGDGGVPIRRSGCGHQGLGYGYWDVSADVRGQGRTH